MLFVLFCFFKQKTAYEMRISDWSSDVCSSDLQINKAYFDVAADLNEDGTVDTTDLIIFDSVRNRATQETRSDVDRAGGVTAADKSAVQNAIRSEERRGGKECVSKCRSRWSQSQLQKKQER